MVFGVQLTMDLLSGKVETLEAVFQSPRFHGVIICIILILSWPGILRYILYVIRIQQYAWHAQLFRRQFFNYIKDMREIDTEIIQEEFGITAEEVDRVFEDALRKGVLRGSFERQGSKRLFVIQPGFEVVPEEERRRRDLSEGLSKVCVAYRTISVEKIGQLFGVPTLVVEKEIMNQIAEGMIHGQLEHGIFVAKAQ